MPHERVIFIPFIFGFGGVERLALSLARFLDDAGISHSIACFQDTIDLASHADWPLSVKPIPARRSMLDEARALLRSPVFRSTAEDKVLVFDLKGALYSQFIPRPCVVHLTDPPSLLPTDITRDAFTNAATVGQALDRLRHPLHSLRAELAHRATRRGVRRAAEVVVMTKAIADEVNRLYGVHCRLLRPGVDTSKAASTAKSGDALRMLSISRLESSKRIDWILDALARLRSQPSVFSANTGWQLDIVGDGSRRKDLEQLSSDLGLTEHVRFHGWLTDDEMGYVAANAGLFLMPAAQGYGLPALESLVRRTPVVVHRDSGVSEILESTPWVRIVSAAEGTDLAPAIAEMAETISQNALSDYPVPKIPSETEWAEEMSRICGWI
jgi:glycosyltransferase involved in cell wall biosynthesis